MTRSSRRSTAATFAAIALALAGCVSDPGSAPTTATSPPSADAATSTPTPPAPTAPPAPAASTEAAAPHVISVILSWRAGRKDVLRIVGKRAITDDADLEAALREELAAHEHDPEPAYASIDARSEVPWKEVVTVVNACKRVGIERLEFSFGRDP